MHITIHASEYNLDYLLRNSSLPSFFLENKLIDLPPYETIIELGAFPKAKITLAEPTCVERVNWSQLEAILRKVLHKLEEIKQPILIYSYNIQTDCGTIIKEELHINVKLSIFISSQGTCSIHICVGGGSFALRDIVDIGLILDGAILTDPNLIIENAVRRLKSRQGG